MSKSSSSGAKPMAEILHVTDSDAWDRARAAGEYRGDTLETEGFLHCCTASQLAGVLARYFGGRTGLVVLRIDTERLKAPLKWESPKNSDEQFPHIYGPLEPDAVIVAEPIEPTDAGS